VNLQEGWCDSIGTLQDVKSKIQMRQEGAFKRERALAYSLAQKVTNKIRSLKKKKKLASLFSVLSKAPSISPSNLLFFNHIIGPFKLFNLVSDFSNHG